MGTRERPVFWGLLFSCCSLLYRYIYYLMCAATYVRLVCSVVADASRITLHHLSDHIALLVHAAQRNVRRDHIHTCIGTAVVLNTRYLIVYIVLVLGYAIKAYVRVNTYAGTRSTSIIRREVFYRMLKACW